MRDETTPKADLMIPTGLDGILAERAEILEAARAFPPNHMLLASTSSAYGANTQRPYTEPDKAEGLARHLPPDQALAWPRPCRYLGARPIRPAQQHHDRGDHVLGNALIIGTRGRIDRNVPPLALAPIDIVEPDPKPANAFQIHGGIQQRAAHLGAIAHDQRPTLASEMPGPVQVIDKRWIVDDLVVRREPGHRCIVHEFSDQDLSHCGRSMGQSLCRGMARIPRTMAFETSCDLSCRERGP